MALDMSEHHHYPQVALSYASDHAAFAVEVERYLQDEGYDVFNYKGKDRGSTTIRALPSYLIEKFKNADLCVLLVSDAYIESCFCQLESEIAHSRLFTEQDCIILGIFGNPPLKRLCGAMPSPQFINLDGMSEKIFAKDYIIAALHKKLIHPFIIHQPAESEKKYGLFFGIPDYRIAYIPVSMENTWPEFRNYRFDNLDVTAKQMEFILKEPYCKWFLENKPKANLPKCRLDYITADHEHLRMGIQPTLYEDYLRSGEQIDFKTTEKDKETFRERFLNKLSPYTGSLRPFEELTNICGVGLFIITKDNQIIASIHSDTSHVYPGRRTFAASGTMPWGACPHPFTAVINKAQEELQHLVDWTKLSLFAIGVDSRKLYFQFSFVENNSVFSANDICKHYKKWENETRNTPRNLICLDIQNEDEICESLITECWEPAAEATLLTLLSNKIGKERVIAALERHKDQWWKRRMRDEWEHRGTRPGLYADMSTRYDFDRLATESEGYINHVKSFIYDHINGNNVVEIGCGTGLITEGILSLNPMKITCIELSKTMEDRHRHKFRDADFMIEYKSGFAQDILPSLREYDVAVCSLVLVHNVGELELDTLIQRLSQSAEHVFLFEDVHKRETSPATRILPENELLTRLKPYFDIKRHEIYHLFDDHILSLHLISRFSSSSI